MQRNTSLFSSAGPIAALLAGSVLAVLTGCGDATFKTDVAHIDPSSVPPDHACLDGSTIELTRYSSACAESSLPLVATVHDGTVFAADAVGALASPCSSGPTAGFEIIFDMAAHSIIFDFSHVRHHARFPNGDFEGYMFDIVLEESNGLLVGLSIDDEASTFALDANDLDWDESHIEVNFEGVAYDDQDLLKLDLIFARLSPLSS